MLKTAKVRFKNNNGYSGKEYEYYTTDSTLKEGDLVVVEVADFYNIAIFQSYTAGSTMATKYIIQKVNTEELEKEKELLFEKELLMSMIRKRVHEVEEMNRFKELSKRDDELKGLVSKLEKLEG